MFGAAPFIQLTKDPPKLVSSSGNGNRVQDAPAIESGRATMEPASSSNSSNQVCDEYGADETSTAEPCGSPVGCNSSSSNQSRAKHAVETPSDIAVITFAFAKQPAPQCKKPPDRPHSPAERQQRLVSSSGNGKCNKHVPENPESTPVFPQAIDQASTSTSRASSSRDPGGSWMGICDSSMKVSVDWPWTCRLQCAELFVLFFLEPDRCLAACTYVHM